MREYETAIIAAKNDDIKRQAARITSLTADIREKLVREEIATNLIVRGEDDPELIMLVLGHVEAADAIVASKIKQEQIPGILNQSYNDWKSYIVRKAYAESHQPAPAPVADDDDTTEDDLPVGMERSDEGETEEG